LPGQVNSIFAPRDRLSRLLAEENCEVETVGLYIAKTDTTVQTETEYLFSDAEQRIIGIAMEDLGIGFDENSLVNIEGMLCIPVTYNQTLTGPTTDRLNVLVHNLGFDHALAVSYTSPPHIIILAVDDTYTAPNGAPFPDFGLTLPPSPQNPFVNHVSVYYNTKPCSGAGEFGVWVNKEGGGTMSASPTLLLYHELAHSYQYVRGGPSNDEAQAITDENEMRDALGEDHRDVNNPGGGCNSSPPPPPPNGPCIIASLATGSPHSSEVNYLRQLRDHILRRSEVGNDFFKHFHYHYYGFSPEVCRLMVQQPTLSPLIKKYFVVPLIAGLELLVHYAEHQGQGLVDLLNQQGKQEDFIEIYKPEFRNQLAAYLRFTETFDQAATSMALSSKERDFEGVADLLRHVNQQTVKDEFINWALVDVLSIWLSSASFLTTQKTDEEINAAIHALISEWISRLPITPIWREFSSLETERELNSLEQFIFDRESKESFAQRLIQKYPKHSTTIRGWAQDLDERAVWERKTRLS